MDAQDLILRILRMFEGTFSLDAAHIIILATYIPNLNLGAVV